MALRKWRIMAFDFANMQNTAKPAVAMATLP
jgi:hypothetical protein